MLLSSSAERKTDDVLWGIVGRPTPEQTADALVDGFHVAWIGSARAPTVASEARMVSFDSLPMMDPDNTREAPRSRCEGPTKSVFFIW